MRRAIALVLTALMSTGCSKAIEIPRDQFEAASRDDSMRHRIELVDGTRYAVVRFSVTDSTLVIEELHRTDERRKKTALPLTIPIADVKSIDAIDIHEGRTFLLAATIVTVVVGGLLWIGAHVAE